MMENILQKSSLYCSSGSIHKRAITVVDLPEEIQKREIAFLNINRACTFVWFVYVFDFILSIIDGNYRVITLV